MPPFQLSRGEAPDIRWSRRSSHIPIAANGYRLLKPQGKSNPAIARKGLPRRDFLRFQDPITTLPSRSIHPDA
jgi:hypothetical protein